MRQMKRFICDTKYYRTILLLAISVILLSYQANITSVQAASTKTYTVKATSTPINVKYIKYSTYNSYTRQYYMLRSYLEQLEKDGGGTLKLSAGTYKISNTLYIPSHVTILLKDGAIVQKIDKTGISSMKSSKSIFQMVRPSKAAVKGAYGEYNGETDIKLIGEGNATINLNFSTDSIGIMMCHNTDVTISGITFQNMKGGHFIELDASKNVIVEKNQFLHHKPSSTGIKEGINIDTPDVNTNGFHAAWTNYDATPDNNVLIQNNYFNDLERAIGTHKYSDGKYHENIQIIDNRIEATTSDAIRTINWSNSIIKGNEISNVDGGSGGKRAVLASGTSNPVITGNTFRKVARPIQLMPWKNNGDGSQYPITYNAISPENITQMLNNTLIDVQERFIRVNKTYAVFDRDTDKYYY